MVLVDPRRREDCPHQGYEGAPEAWVEIPPRIRGRPRRDRARFRAPGRIRVRPLEALDGTPVIDIKPVLAGSADG